MVGSVMTVTCAASAVAMEAIEDATLSQVTGQDGLSVVADLHVKIGSIGYGDSTKNTSAALTDVTIDGLGALMLDVITGQEFVDGATGALLNSGISPGAVGGILAEVALQSGYQLGSDVIQISMPDIDLNTYPEAGNLGLNVSAAAVTTGNGGKSMGSLSVNGINPMGTKVWMYGHD